jgi:hypothetical protein
MMSRRGIADSSGISGRHPETSDEELRERPDGGGEDHGSDADRPTEQPSGAEHRDLDPGAGQPQRPAGPGGQPGHQAVAGTGAEAGPDVEAGRDAVERDPAEQQREPRRQGVRRRQDPERGVRGQADDHDVGRRADPRPLPQRDPRQQHHRAGQDHDPPQRQAGVPGQALVQHVPRGQPQPRGHHQRRAGAEEDEAGEELDRAAQSR